MPTLANLVRGLKSRTRAQAFPGLILMTDAERLADPRPAIESLPRGSAVILRHYGVADRAALARALAALCRGRGLVFLVAGDPRLAVAVGADGLHLPEALVRRERQWRLWRRPGWLVTAAAHSLAAVMRAVRAGVDAVLVSPVFPTGSHPEAAPLGSLRFAAIARRSPVAVYALGGVTAETARRLAGSGACGFAAIRGLTDTRRCGAVRRWNSRRR